MSARTPADRVPRDHLALYFALAGAAFFVVAVVARGGGRLGLPAAIVAFVCFFVAVCLNLPGVADQMLSDRNRAAGDDDRA